MSSISNGSQGKKRQTARRVRIKDLNRGKYVKEEGFNPNYLLTPYGLKISRAMIVATVVDKFKNDDESFGSITVDDGSDTIRGKYFQDLSQVDQVELGDIIQLIGKVREYNGDLYLNPELLKKRDIIWELLQGLHYLEMRKNWQKHLEKAHKLVEDKGEETAQETLKTENLTEFEIEGLLIVVQGEEDMFEAARKERKERGSKQGKSGWGSKDQKQGEGSEQGEGGGDENQEQAILEIIEELDEGEGADYSAISDKADLGEEELESVVNSLLSDGTCYEPRPGRIKKL